MRIAICGLGFMGTTHLKALRHIPAAQLAAVASADTTKLSGDLSQIQGNLGGGGAVFDFSHVRKFTRYQDVLDDPNVEAVDLCLPTHLHAPAAIAALKAGKHVLVEKPMALSGGEADAMIRAARETGKVLMVAQVLRFFPSYVALRNAIRSGALGPVRSAVFRRRCAAPGWGKWLKNRSLSGGGVFDLLIHDIDFCLHLFGAPKAVSATGFENLDGGLDFISAQLYYDSVASVLITGGWHHKDAYPFSMEYTVQTDGGTLEYRSDGRDASLYRADGSVERLPEPSTDGFQAELEYFLECCRANAAPAQCPPEESAAAVKLGLLLLESREKGGEKLPCNL